MNARQMFEKQFIVFLFISLISFINAFECPQDCTCWDHHAKCRSLDGLTRIDNTNELHSLDVSEISLRKLTDHFDKLTNLTKLDLHDNQLSEVNSLKSKEIQELNLSQNEFTSEELLTLPISVRHLNLTKNRITHLPLESKKFVDLKSLELTDNPIDCTCETIQIRDWLAEKNVQTDNVICVTPDKYESHSWRSVHLSDVCSELELMPKVIQEDNDLMQADGTDVVDNKSSEDAGDDELNKDYLPVSKTNAKGNEHKDGEHIKNEDLFEGSGAEEDTTQQIPETSSIQTNLEKENEDEDEEEIEEEEDVDEPRSNFEVDAPHQEISGEDTNSNAEQPATDTTTIASAEETNATEQTEVPDIQGSLNGEGRSQADPEDSSNEISIEVTESETEQTTDTTIGETDISLSGLLPDTNASVAESNINEQTEVPEERSLAVKVPNTETEPVQSHGETNATSVSASVKADSTHTANGENKVEEGNSTFILLGVLAVLLVVLILYVATKRSKKSTPKNRRNNNDIENPAQELLTMDKNNLGKPIQPNNGTEIIPLIGSKAPVNKGNSLSNAQEPLLKRLTEEDEEDRSGTSSEGRDTGDAPSTPIADHSSSTAPQESPVSEKQANTEQAIPTASPTQNGVHSTPKENGEQDFQPTSPKSSSRYSPVYSHDTGRVKIKLTETAKPKTPILVTRARSDAGDNKFINQIND